jgi:hypothetical protein
MPIPAASRREIELAARLHGPAREAAYQSRRRAASAGRRAVRRVLDAGAAPAVLGAGWVRGLAAVGRGRRHRLALPAQGLTAAPEICRGRA